MWLPPTFAAGNPVSWSWGFESAVGRISFFIDFQIKTHVRYPPIRRPILKHVGVSYSSSKVRRRGTRPGSARRGVLLHSH